MSLTRSLHPPAAGTALTGVLGGSLISPADWWFPLSPVAIDAVALVAVGLIFHHLLGHPYPHRRKRRAWVLDAAATVHDDLSEKDLDAVLARLGQTYDIEREDLRMLLQELERRGRDRRRSYNGQCNVGTVRIGDEVR
jgi:CBS domain-containing membrane protein